MITGIEASEKILEGINKAADAVKGTLGPKARTVILQRENNFPLVFNDGVSIVRAVHDDDPYVNMGVNLAQQIAIQAQLNAGDGTTTSLVIAQKLCQLGIEALKDGACPVELKDQIDKFHSTLKHRLDNLADKNFTLEDVATIAANNDSKLGKMIGDIFGEFDNPNECVISLEESHGLETTYEILEGLEFHKGMMSPLLVNSTKGSCELDNPVIVLTNEVLSNFNSVVPALKIATEQNRPILIIARKFTGNAMTNTIVNIVQGNLRGCLVEAPSYGGDMNSWLEDISAVTGARVFRYEADETIERITAEDVGSAKKVTSNHKKTVIVKNPNVDNELNKHISSLYDLKKEADHEWDIDKITKRIVRLEGGVASISVGGATEIEVKEKKERLDDAINATKAALEDGVVKGAGYALIECITGYEKNVHSLGESILTGAITEPYKRILANAGIDAVGLMGFKEVNAKTGEIGVDLLKQGIIDPVKVTISSLESAVSIATLMIMTDVAIPLQKED
mgnify:FL=1